MKTRVLSGLLILIFAGGATACSGAAPQTVATKGVPAEEPTVTTVDPNLIIDHMDPSVVTSSTSVSRQPVIPGPPKKGEKIAVVPPEQPPRPLNTYLACPSEDDYVNWADYREGCRLPARGSRPAVWLRAAIVDCRDGREALEIGPSAPRPLAWVHETPSPYDGPNFTYGYWHWGQGDTFFERCGVN